MSNSSTGYVYTVKQLRDHRTQQSYRNPHYVVAKFGDDAEPSDVYDVILPGTPGKNLYCNCPGFHRQKAPKETHKHIRLVKLFVELGEPAGAVFEIEPDGSPKLVGNLLEG